MGGDYEENTPKIEEGGCVNENCDASDVCACSVVLRVPDDVTLETLKSLNKLSCSCVVLLSWQRGNCVSHCVCFNLSRNRMRLGVFLS